MTINITYPERGRGAWSNVGGLRSLDGSKVGNQYRSTTNPALPVIGEETYQKFVSSAVEDASIDEYAVWRGAVEIQAELRRLGFYNMTIDGRWGPGTDRAVKNWQEWVGTDVSGRPMIIDGIYGQQTARTMWEPVLLGAVKSKANSFFFMPSAENIEMLNDYAKATVTLESSWDIAAVGYITPKDNGLSQINTDAHKIEPSLAFSPRYAFDFKMKFVLENFAYALGDLEIAMCSYNVGRGGAWNWHKAGRPVDAKAAEYLRALKKHLTNERLLDALERY